MIDTIVNDVSAIFSSTFMNGDWIALLIAFGSVLVAALVMKRATQIGAMTLLGLVLFVIGWFMRGVLRGPFPESEAGAAAAATGNRMLAQINAQWAQFMGMEAGTLLAYFITFMLLIMMIFGVKSVVQRG
ncbi:MAG: hypothetical protein AAGD92_00960 [Pseudomonadota bacterium]